MAKRDIIEECDKLIAVSRQCTKFMANQTFHAKILPFIIGNTTYCSGIPV